MNNRIAIGATLVVLANLAVAMVHGNAHDQLGVGLSTWQTSFVWSVIVVAPLIAAPLYWTPLRRAGALLLGLSMLAAALFGIYYHFIAVSNDHVSHLPEGDAQGVFIATAIALVPFNLLGAAYGFWSWRRLARSVSATQT